MSDSKPRRKAPWWLVVLGVILAPLILVVLLLALVLFVISTISIHIIIWAWWCLRSRDILVYSNSPIWHDYVEQHILPHLGKRAVILNWSERKGWRFSLAKIAFYHFGGYRQYNPLGVVFRPFRRSKAFRFWQAFRDFKHGHPEALQKMEREFFGFIGVTRNDLLT